MVRPRRFSSYELLIDGYCSASWKNCHGSNSCTASRDPAVLAKGAGRHVRLHSMDDARNALFQIERRFSNTVAAMLSMDEDFGTFWDRLSADDQKRLKVIRRHLKSLDLLAHLPRRSSLMAELEEYN